LLLYQAIVSPVRTNISGDARSVRATAYLVGVLAGLRLLVSCSSASHSSNADASPDSAKMRGGTEAGRRVTLRWAAMARRMARPSRRRPVEAIYTTSPVAARVEIGPEVRF
jgi:hypothetical protein